MYKIIFFHSSLWIFMCILFLYSDKVQMHEVRRCVHLTCQHLSARCKRILLSVHSGLFSELIVLVLTMKNINISIKLKKSVKQDFDLLELKFLFFFFFPLLSSGVCTYLSQTYVYSQCYYFKLSNVKIYDIRKDKNFPISLSVSACHQNRFLCALSERNKLLPADIAYSYSDNSIQNLH